MATLRSRDQATESSDLMELLANSSAARTSEWELATFSNNRSEGDFMSEAGPDNAGQYDSQMMGPPMTANNGDDNHAGMAASQEPGPSTPPNVLAGVLHLGNLEVAALKAVFEQIDEVDRQALVNSADDGRSLLQRHLNFVAQYMDQLRAENDGYWSERLGGNEELVESKRRLEELEQQLANAQQKARMLETLLAELKNPDPAGLGRRGQ
jgi:hypothetical protein